MKFLDLCVRVVPDQEKPYLAIVYNEDGVELYRGEYRAHLTAAYHDYSIYVNTQHSDFLLSTPLPSNIIPFRRK